MSVWLNASSFDTNVIDGAWMSLSVGGPDRLSPSIRSGLIGVSSHCEKVRDNVEEDSRSIGSTKSSGLIGPEESSGRIAESWKTRSDPFLIRNRFS